MRDELLGSYFVLDDGIGKVLSRTSASCFVRWSLLPSGWALIPKPMKVHITHKTMERAEVITPDVAHELLYLRRRTV